MAWRIDRLRFTLLLGFLATTCCVFFSTAAASDPEQISVAKFRRIVAEFVAKHNVPTNEIISQQDVLPLLAVLESAGMILDRKELMKMIPGDQSSLVQLLRTPNGRKFIGQTSNNKLMFDRLERIGNEPGGKRLLRDLMKLPAATLFSFNTPQVITGSFGKIFDEIGVYSHLSRPSH